MNDVPLFIFQLEEHEEERAEKEDAVCDVDEGVELEKAIRTPKNAVEHSYDNSEPGKIASSFRLPGNENLREEEARRSERSKDANKRFEGDHNAKMLLRCPPNAKADDKKGDGGEDDGAAGREVKQ